MAQLNFYTIFLHRIDICMHYIILHVLNDFMKFSLALYWKAFIFFCTQFLTCTKNLLFSLTAIFSFGVFG